MSKEADLPNGSCDDIIEMLQEHEESACNKNSSCPQPASIPDSDDSVSGATYQGVAVAAESDGIDSS